MSMSRLFLFFRDIGGTKAKLKQTYFTNLFNINKAHEFIDGKGNEVISKDFICCPCRRGLAVDVGGKRSPLLWRPTYGGRRDASEWTDAAARLKADSGRSNRRMPSAEVRHPPFDLRDETAHFMAANDMTGLPDVIEATRGERSVDPSPEPKANVVDEPPSRWPPAIHITDVISKRPACRPLTSGPSTSRRSQQANPNRQGP